MFKRAVIRRFVVCIGWLAPWAAGAAWLLPVGVAARDAVEAGKRDATPGSAGRQVESGGRLAMTVMPRQQLVEASKALPDENCLGGDAWRRHPLPPDVSQEDARIRDLKSWQTFRDCPDCPEMQVLPGGKFTMGARGLAPDEEPPHQVALPAFAVGKYEVTVGQFRQFARSAAREPGEACRAWAEGNGKWELEGKIDWNEPGYPHTADFPVVCVSWGDAVDYARWLSETTGKRYRLLSEAEWEYAARGSRDAKDHDQTYWGAEDRQACRYGNFADATALGEFSWPDKLNCADGAWFASAVGQYRPNRFGLYDMLGNVWEWTEDCSTPDYSQGAPDGRPYTCGQCDRRMIRGGSWASKPANIRIGNRARAPVDRRSVTIGFRVARDLE